MRPPVLPSGNLRIAGAKVSLAQYASMRPPVLPSGNRRCRVNCGNTLPSSFNEAARFYPAETPLAGQPARRPNRSFNEAAGFTQRKLARGDGVDAGLVNASMRPPVLPSGNPMTLIETGAMFAVLQ